MVQDAGNIRDAKLPLDILLCEYESCTTTNAGVFSFSCLALDSSSSFPCPAFRAIAKSFIYMVYYIDRLSYVEPSLHLWDKAYLVMVDNIFDVFLESVCQYFIEYFCIYVHEGDCCYIPNFISGFINFDALSLPFGDFASSCSRAFSFNLIDPSIGESGVLKSPTINVWGLINVLKEEEDDDDESNILKEEEEDDDDDDEEEEEKNKNKKKDRNEV
ncbi:hypothetical protein STEG23_022615 [Scotinomys teguina]